MKRDGSETVASNGEESLAAQQDLPSARSSPVPLGPASAHAVANSSASAELLRQALEGDQDAWARVEQYLGETARSWLHDHPGKEAAGWWESEEQYLTQAFERFWQAIADGQLRICTSLSTALKYLQASLHGVLLDALRANTRPGGIALQRPAHAEEQAGEDHTGDHQLWERIQRLFPDVRERRVAYLLFHCNLSPRDILHHAPQEFRDVQEICHLRHHILERVLLHSGVSFRILPYTTVALM